jgi:plastocyanin
MAKTVIKAFQSEHAGMSRIAVLFILLICGNVGVATALAGEAAVSGRVVITKLITRKRVTLPSYDLRGATVNENLGKTARGDPAVNELSRVVIYLEGPGLRPAAPIEGTLRQKDRQFDPEILVIPLGSRISFPNEDPIFHNVFSLSKTKQFDLGYYPAGETRVVEFDRPGVVQVYCHIHPEMSAAIVVLSTAFWTRPSPDGRFTLSGFPSGGYDLVAWHRFAGFFRRHITASDGTTSAEDFVIPVKNQEPGAGQEPESSR